MIPNYNGFNAQVNSGARAILPAGNYIAKIKQAEVAKTRNGGTQLIINFDIDAGDYAGFFAADYRAQTDDTKKWRGVYRLFIPTGDGSAKDGYAVRNCNNLAGCLEDSNPGYHWDWDERKFKGLSIGVMFREKEWEFNGRTGWTTECGGVATVEAVSNGSLKVMKPKALSNTAPAAQNFVQLPDDEDGDLPF